MATIDKAIKDFLESELRQLHTLTLGKVMSYDEATREAVVQPLIMQKLAGQDPTPFAPITMTPHLKHRYRNPDGTERQEVPIYKNGDVVLIAIVERAMDASLNGAIAYPDARRRHSLTDAIILGVIA